VVFGTHTGSTNGPPKLHNRNPARTIRTPTHRYILNLTPELQFKCHITELTPTGERALFYLPFWDSWKERAKADTKAATAVARYLYRPREELYDLTQDPYEMKNIADEPDHTELLEDLRGQLYDWCEAQGDEDPLLLFPERSP
jgi:uncharacterized sulfatase